MLSFLSTGIAKDDLDLDFSIKLNLEWEDIYTEHTSSTGIQEFFGDIVYFENGYLVIWISKLHKKRDKNTGINYERLSEYTAKSYWEIHTRFFF